MDELWEEIQAEKELIENTLAELAKALQGSDRSYVVLAGMAAFVHNVYNGMENIMKRMLVAKKHSLDLRSPFWHHDLLKAAIAQQIISEKLGVMLKDYLGFRHFFVHAYGVLLDAEKLLPLANNAADVWRTFYAELVSAFQAMEK
jgi:uncharacterized protein YutE (UPF0331/DUF86 family)